MNAVKAYYFFLSLILVLLFLSNCDTGEIGASSGNEPLRLFVVMFRELFVEVLKLVKEPCLTAPPNGTPYFFKGAKCLVYLRSSMVENF